MRCVLGVDIGTSSLKVVAVDETQTVVAVGQAAYHLSTPQAGWVEQDPADWWNALLAALRDIYMQVDVTVVAVGLSGQMHTMVALGADGQPTYNALSWADTRTRGECVDIGRAFTRDEWVHETGNPLVAALTVSKLTWLRRWRPAAFAATETIMFPKDYLRYRLTGQRASDVSDVSASGMNNLVTRTWSATIAERLDLPTRMLPPVCESGIVAGRVTPAAAAATGLPVECPVVAGAGDQECAALGAGVLKPGPLLVTVGTGGQVFAAVDRPLFDRQARIHALCHAIPDTWHVMAAIQAAGLALQWMGQLFWPAAHDAVEHLLALADTATPSATTPLFLPHLTGDRTPHMDDSARGVLFGLDIAHQQADLCWAAVEGVMFGLAACIDVLEELGVATTHILLTGGLSRHPLIGRLLAATRGVAVQPLPRIHASGFGAARLAGAAVGLWQISEILMVSEPPPHYPERDLSDLTAYRYQRFRDLYPALAAQFVTLE